MSSLFSDSNIKQGEILKGTNDEHKPLKNIGGLALSVRNIYSSERIDSESKRLQDMAEKYGNDVSLEAMSCFDAPRSSESPLIMLDIGCGDSTTLAHRVDLEKGFVVIPTDKRLEAVTAHVRAGFNEARLSTANCLMLNDNSVDISHSRFTWGWLSPTERLASLAEMIRVGKPSTGITVIDYDWSVCDGPPEFMDAIGAVTSLLREQGFDPDFGKKLPIILPEYLDKLHDSTVAILLTTSRHETYSGPIAGSVNDIISTAQPLLEQLAKFGKDDDMKSRFSNLLHFIDNNPEAMVRLPDIVSFSVALDKNEESLTGKYKRLLRISSSRRKANEPLEDLSSEVDFDDILGRGTSGRAKTTILVDALRRTQAINYYDSGIVGEEAIGSEGYLVEENDPQSLVDRSKYFFVAEGGVIKAQVRSIMVDESVGPASLPVVDWFMRHSSDARTILEKEGLLEPGLRVVEISGLAENRFSGNFIDTIEAVVALTRSNADEGVTKAVMSLNENHVEVIRNIFGRNNLRRLGGDEFIHSLDNLGVKSGLRFVPLITDNNFIPKAKQNIELIIDRLRKNRKQTGVYEKILEIVESGMPKITTQG